MPSDAPGFLSVSDPCQVHISSALTGYKLSTTTGSVDLDQSACIGVHIHSVEVAQWRAVREEYRILVRVLGGLTFARALVSIRAPFAANSSLL